MTSPTHHRTRGFALVELLVTAVVLGTAFVAATWSMSATARTKEVYAQAKSPAFFLAKEIHELAAGLPRAPSGVTGATTGSGILALDSLVGSSFSPPVLSDGSTADEFKGWTQQVDLAVYDLDDPSTPTTDAPEDGLPADSAKLYRLEVLVQDDGEDIGTFHWWLNP